MPTPLEDAVEVILKDGKVPGFSRQLQGLLGSTDGQSAQKLAEVVLADLGLTVKVLQVANSYQYNRTTRPIESVSHAIVVMGAQTVRTIASSLLFIDHFSARAPGLKPLMLLSMLAAHHAAAAARVTGFKATEDAHLAGMFRNLGEVIVASHFPEQYAQVNEQSDGGNRLQQACVAVLHYKYEDLARAMGTQWRLPTHICDIWSAVSSTQSAPLVTLAQFGHNVATALYRVPGGDQETRMKLLLMQHGHRLGLTKDTLAEIVETAFEQTQPILALVNMNLDALRAAFTPPPAPPPPVAPPRPRPGQAGAPAAAPVRTGRPMPTR